ncbi:hypothetical protein E2C01_072938 [Portunus trituberculatus]|uniref:Uncharacterized protein n=1 Tax=Portunus trituberculatus TaxID=210409 RepID=A0A5B7I3W9_PORTR|nr:hypothetical protein [Portunus trituberculatus]
MRHMHGATLSPGKLFRICIVSRGLIVAASSRVPPAVPVYRHCLSFIPFTRVIKASDKQRHTAKLFSGNQQSQLSTKRCVVQGAAV